MSNYKYVPCMSIINYWFVVLVRFPNFMLSFSCFVLFFFPKVFYQILREGVKIPNSNYGLVYFSFQLDQTCLTYFKAVNFGAYTFRTAMAYGRLIPLSKYNDPLFFSNFLFSTLQLHCTGFSLLWLLSLQSLCCGAHRIQ